MSKFIRGVAALLFTGAAAFAQAPDQKACSVDGFVANSVSGAPVSRAYINVAVTDDNVVVESDAAGKWKVPEIACGSVSITVRRVGFLPKQRALPPPAITLVADNPVHDFKLELAPQAVIAGRVLDDQGDPVQGAQVRLMTSQVSNGVRGFQAAISMGTNDLGEYRFAGLTAGRYVVCAKGESPLPPFVYVDRPLGEKCYPGPLDAGVPNTMDVAAGYEGRVDFVLSPVSGVQVRGVVSAMPKDADLVVILNNRGAPGEFGSILPGNSAPVRHDRSFVIKDVAPGSYTLFAGLNGRLMARTTVDVGSNDIDGITLRLEAGVTVTGTIKAISPTGKKPDDRPLVFLKSSEMEANTVNWHESGTSFTMSDVMPGNYRLSFSTSAPFYLKSATVADRDIAGSEVAIGPSGANIEIVLSDDGGTVEGDISADDMPAAGWVFIEKDGAPSRNTHTDAKGHFKIDALPPGDYKVYAWDDNANVEYANPEWMQRNGKGVAVSVAPGQTTQVKLIRQTAPTE